MSDLRFLYLQFLTLAFGASVAFGVANWINDRLDKAFMFFLFAVLCELERLMLKGNERE